MDLNLDVNSVIIQNKLKRDGAIASQQASNTVAQAIQPPTNPNSNTLPITEPVSSNPPVVEPKAVPQEPTTKDKEEPVKPEPSSSPTAAEAPKEPVIEQAWDDGIPEPSTVVETPKSVDFKKLSSALKLEAQTEDEFLTAVNKRLEEASLNNVPEELKQAIDIAKKGGDWKSYAGAAQIDLTKLDAVELFERQYERENLVRFKNPDGSVNLKALDDELDSIPEGMKRLQGESLKRELISRQHQQQSAIIAQAMRQQEQFQTNLGLAAKELQTLLPQDQFGYKIEAKHSAYFYEGIANGTLIKKHFGDVDPSVLLKTDAKKLMRTIVLAELGDKISQFNRKQGETVGKKSLLQSTQNIQLQTSSSLPRPAEVVVEQKSTADMLREKQERMKPKNSL